VDKGSTFYFEVDFPVAVPGDDRASTSRMLNSSIPSKPRAVRRGRILLAEDNEVNQQVAAMFLERLGFDVNVVANGQEAVDALEREPFDAVLMDCQMPVMDGFQATAKIREMSGSVGRIPIIAVTASAMPQERDKCLAAGMDDFVSKPVFPDALNEVLVNALANRKRMQSPTYSASLSEILGGDMSLLIDVYAKSTAEQLEKMTEALELHDLQTAAIAAHSMKGASATIALDEMAEIARRIETAVKDGDRDTAIDLCNVAKAMSVDVVDKLRAEYS
jgi:two-component system sensor histidine kinase/response regulator